MIDVAVLGAGLGGLSAQVADPRFSTGVGLVLQAARPETNQGMFTDNGNRPTRGRFDLWDWFASRF